MPASACSLLRGRQDFAFGRGGNAGRTSGQTNSGNGGLPGFPLLNLETGAHNAAGVPEWAVSANAR